MAHDSIARDADDADTLKTQVRYLTRAVDRFIASFTVNGPFHGQTTDLLKIMVNCNDAAKMLLRRSMDAPGD